MIANPLNHMYAPNYIEVLVSQQGQDIYDNILRAIQQNQTNIVYDQVIYDQNLMLLKNHGFKIVSVPSAMTIANSVVKYTISWG